VCYAESEVFSVSVNGKPVSVIAYSNNGKIEYHYAQFSFSGTVSVKVTVKKDIKTYRIRPESYAIAGTVKGNSLAFRLEQSRYLVINIDALQKLVLIADPLEENVPASSGDALFNVANAPYNADRTGSTTVTEILQRAIDDASVAKGTVYVPAGVYQSASLTLKSDVDLYLEGGAVLRGTGKQADYTADNPRSKTQRIATFIRFAEGATNMAVRGRGTLDANGELLHDAGGGKDPAAIRISGIRPDKNSHVTLDGLIVSHCSTWTIVPQQSDHLRIQNLKVLNSEFRSENDGIDINSCQHVLVRHCFVHTNDDSLCAKPCAAGNFKGVIQGPDEVVHDVVFEDIVTYGRCAGAKVGLQGYTDVSSVWFKNIEVLQASRGIVIQHYQGSATVEDVHFVNINVEDLVYRVYKPYPIQLHITSDGNIRNVEITNATFKSFGDGKGPDGFNGQNSMIAGKSRKAAIENVVFTNLKIAGNTILDSASGRIDINEFASGVVFSTAAETTP
jgi:polygalacturonase